MTLEHSLQQLVVELKADTVRVLDRQLETGDAIELPIEDKGPL